MTDCFFDTSALVKRYAEEPGTETFDDHEDTRLAAAIHLYENVEISLGKAARLAGVARFDMPDILREHGVDVKHGPEDMDDAHQEIDVARDLE